MSHGLLTHCERMIGVARQQNAIPVAFIMSRRTKASVMVMLDYEREKKQSVLQKLLARFKRHPANLNLFGIPVLTNDNFIDGMISLQTALLGQPGPASTEAPANALCGSVAKEQAAQGINPFAERVPVKAEDESAPTLAQLASSRGDMPSPTDVLIKAMEGADALQHVLVVRAHHNGDVELGCSGDLFVASGMLQKAQIYIASRGNF